MKKLFLVILFYLFSQVSSLANDIDTRLNQLFNQLKANKSKVAFIIEQEIYPAMRSPKIMIKQIEELMKQQTI